MKIRKHPQKKSLWNILPRAVKKRIWMPGLFALLLGTDEALKQYAQEYLEPGEERVLPAENFCTVRSTIRDLHLDLCTASGSGPESVSGRRSGCAWRLGPESVQERASACKDRHDPDGRRSGRQSSGPPAPRQSRGLYRISFRTCISGKADG